MAIKRLSFCLAVLLAAHVVAGSGTPPTIPMLLHGQVLVNGRSAPAGTAITFNILGTRVIRKTMDSGLGFATYSVLIPDADTAAIADRLNAGETIRIEQVGTSPLPGVLVVYRAGSVVSMDLQSPGPGVQAPAIRQTTTQESESGKELILQCAFSLATGSPSGTAYEVFWYLPPDVEGGAPVLLEQASIVPHAGATGVDVNRRRAVDEVPDWLYLVVTPTLPDHRGQGPSTTRIVWVDYAFDDL